MKTKLIALFAVIVAIIAYYFGKTPLSMSIITFLSLLTLCLIVNKKILISDFTVSFSIAVVSACFLELLHHISVPWFSLRAGCSTKSEFIHFYLDICKSELEFAPILGFLMVLLGYWACPKMRKLLNKKIE